MDTAVTTLKRVGPGIAVLALLVGGAALVARRFGGPDHPGLLLLLAGQVALALATFSPREIGWALAHAFRRPQNGARARRARHFWEAAARNAGLLGALGAFVGFVALFSNQDGALDFPTVVAPRVLGPWLLALLLAALMAVPALREGAPAVDDPPLAEAPAAGGLSFSMWVGYGLFAALLAWIVLAPAAQPGFRALEWLAHGPAWLVVLGGGLAAALYLGDLGRGRSLTLALAVTGLAAALGGLLQALHGFAIVHIATVASGLTFLFSSCVAALVGLAAVGLPLEDRARRDQDAVPARIVWYGFPLAAVLLLIVAMAMVLTPMTVPAGR